MRHGRFIAGSALALLAACSGGEGNVSANQSNDAAAEGEDLNMAISGDELSPIPEAEDDMVANNSVQAESSLPPPYTPPPIGTPGRVLPGPPPTMLDGTPRLPGNDLQKKGASEPPAAPR
jgi:hypothetical protein